MRTGRPKPPLTLTEDERETLGRWTRRPTTARALAERAKIVLECAAGKNNIVVAHDLRVIPQTIGKWRTRFLRHRLDGLLDEPRPGAPRRITDGDVERVMRLTLETTPRDATHWSTRAMARRCGLGQRAVSRIWRAFSLRPHRAKTFKLSKDPLFIEKVRDIVGLYLNPPDKALVLCVDEKAQIQALDRTQPLLPMQPGQVERCTHDYTRHGTTSLFAALNVKTGKVIGQFHQRHRDGTSCIPRHHRGCGAGHARRACDSRQLRHPQDPAHPPLARAPSALPRALLANRGLVDHFGRALVRYAHRQAGAAWRPSQHPRVGNRHRPLHRGDSRTAAAVRVDQDRRPDPCERCPILSSNL